LETWFWDEKSWWTMQPSFFSHTAVSKLIRESEKPDFIKVDSVLVLIGSASGKRNSPKSYPSFPDHQQLGPVPQHPHF